ncbi:MAG: SM-20-related protein [Thermoleophilaceae bacterium]|nr:SM-20-related protein [Thermoleophilaceae bacterium]
MSNAGPTTTSELPGCIPGFLDPGECRDLIAEMDASSQQEAEIWLGQDFAVDPRSRLSTIATLTATTEAFVQDRLWGVMPELEARYGCEVSHVSAATALIYHRAGHFAAHSDGGIDEDAPPEVTRRRVSLVVALNDGATAQPDFTGGELRFYPRCPPGATPAAHEPVIDVRSEPGLLIAFPSPMVHQVMPVIDGHRYSLALWALAPEC